MTNISEILATNTILLLPLLPGRSCLIAVHYHLNTIQPNTVQPKQSTFCIQIKMISGFRVRRIYGKKGLAVAPKSMHDTYHRLWRKWFDAKYKRRHRENVELVIYHHTGTARRQRQHEPGYNVKRFIQLNGKKLIYIQIQDIASMIYQTQKHLLITRSIALRWKSTHFRRTQFSLQKNIKIPGF